MSMVSHVLGKLSKNEIEIGLPWFRAVPYSCIENITLNVDGITYSSALLELLIGNKFYKVNELSDLDLGEWFPQDRKHLKFPASLSAGQHDVKIEFSVVIPNLLKAPNEPVILPMSTQNTLTVH